MQDVGVCLIWGVWVGVLALSLGPSIYLHRSGPSDSVSTHTELIPGYFLIPSGIW